MGCNKCKPKPPGTRKRRKKTALPAQGTKRRDWGAQTRNVVDIKVNCNSKQLQDNLFRSLKERAHLVEKKQGKKKQPAGLVVSWDGKDWKSAGQEFGWSLNVTRDAQLRSLLTDTAKFLVGESSARLIDGEGKEKYSYKNQAFNPCILERHGTPETPEHVDYDSTEMSTQSPLYTLYVVLQAISPVQFTVDFENAGEKKFFLEEGDGLYFPSNRSHHVTQSLESEVENEPFRTVITAHFTTDSYKSYYKR